VLCHLGALCEVWVLKILVVVSYLGQKQQHRQGLEALIKISFLLLKSKKIIVNKLRIFTSSSN
jgi:hypothetical protein